MLECRPRSVQPEKEAEAMDLQREREREREVRVKGGGGGAHKTGENKQKPNCYKWQYGHPNNNFAVFGR